MMEQSPVIRLAPISPQNAETFKVVRLRALQDTPSAFGSTYAKEAQLTDDDWVKRAERWGTTAEGSAGYIAMDGDFACGLVCSFLDQEDATRAHLISMWTAPTHRRQGLGRRLVNEVLAWARSRGATTMWLMVTSSNEAAMTFYEGMGFTRTGRTEPYPNDPAVIEYEMSRPLAGIVS
jgi:ribosomal protein S18 acetylase RimI-like enzyme